MADVDKLTYDFEDFRITFSETDAGKVKIKILCQTNDLKQCPWVEFKLILNRLFPNLYSRFSKFINDEYRSV